MKTLHILPSLSRENGGLPVAVARLTAALAEDGSDHMIITTDLASAPQAGTLRTGATPDDLVELSPRVEVVLCRSTFPKRFAFSRDLSRELDRHTPDYDFVHIHSLFLYPQFAAWRAARRVNKPFAVSLHGTLDYPLRRRGYVRKRMTDLLWQKRMLAQAEAIVCTSTQERDSVLGLSLNQALVVLPLGLPDESFEPIDDASRFRRDHLDDYQGPIILNHGRLSAKKNLDLLVSAVAKMRDVRLVFIGPDEEGIGDQLQILARTLGIADRVYVLPPMQGIDLRRAVACASIWALPSSSENFGLAVLEAMAIGVPVVASPFVNIAALATGHHAAIIVDNNSDHLARAFTDLLTSPIKQASLMQEGHQFATNYQWTNLVTQYRQFYERCVKDFH